MRNGAYLVKDVASPEVVVVATGSEVSMAIAAVEKSGRKARIVSMPSRELFEAVDPSERARLLPPGVPVVAVEAGVAQGWEEITGTRSRVLSINRFGESGPGKKVAEHLGFTAEKLAALISSV